jgi:pimeloyl-ACP methyl ester carboxylesterase
MVGRGIFTCYADIIENLKKINPTRPLIIPETMDDYSPKNNWHDFKKPVFLIVGDLDERTPKENSIEILQNVKSNVRELWIVDKAGHGGWEAPEIIDRYLFIKKTVQFFQENL